MDMAEQIVRAARALGREAGTLRFSEPVTHVYNPLEYAISPHEAYIRRYCTRPKQVIFLGMNPGPFGMAQTGIPFGEVAAVRDWMGIGGVVKKPGSEHAKRPVEGFSCTRSEVSGQRLWGLFAERFGAAENFFADHYVANYCPLVFMNGTGQNVTPDKLPAGEARPLFDACDRHLKKLVETLAVQRVVGIGKFAEKCAARLFADTDVKIGGILHPSPASPLANKDWAGTATRQLVEQGVW